MGITVIDQLLLKIDVQKDRAMTKIETFQRNLNKINKNLKMQDRLNKAGLGNATQFSKKLAKSLAEAEFRQKNFIKQLRVIRKSLLLAGASFIFMGMALKRFFQDILQSLLANYLMIEGEMGPVNEAINGLKSNVSGMAFGFADAFVKSGMLQEWIDLINGIVNWLDDWDEKNKALAINFSIYGLIIGTTLLVIGAGIIFITMLLKALEYLAPATFASMVLKSEAAWTAIKLGAMLAIRKIGVGLLWLAEVPLVYLFGAFLLLLVLYPLLNDHFDGFSGKMKKGFFEMISYFLKLLYDFAISQQQAFSIGPLKAYGSAMGWAAKKINEVMTNLEPFPKLVDEVANERKLAGFQAQIDKLSKGGTTDVLDKLKTREMIDMADTIRMNATSPQDAYLNQITRGDTSQIMPNAIAPTIKPIVDGMTGGVTLADLDKSIKTQNITLIDMLNQQRNIIFNITGGLSETDLMNKIGIMINTNKAFGQGTPQL